HNIYNIMVALGFSMIMNINHQLIQTCIYQFKGVSYRLQAKIGFNNLTFYNDAKATSPDATMTAIKAMDKPFILIMGGYDKQLNYDELAQLLKNNTLLTKVYCYGMIRFILQESIKDKVIVFETLDEVIADLKQHNDQVDILFSPGTSSYDQFENFEQRGAYFDKLIEKENH
ncbi:MAG: glutamate ligase domain-containing protein, partial [Bacilli bacterium]